VLAGGIENMSQAPFLISYRARFGLRFGSQEMQDHMILDGLTDVFNKVHMGLTAEALAEEFNISREAQDEFAYNSQMKAKAAIEAGKFKDEIVPVEVPDKKGVKIFDTDEYPRFDTTLESLAKLRPAFKPNGTITAGNASGINDGGREKSARSKSSISTNGRSSCGKLVASSAPTASTIPLWIRLPRSSA